MDERICIVGVGLSKLNPITPEVSFRELVFESATKAYQDAGIEPKNVDTFVALSEDYQEGTAIFDEYVPDQLGAVLKPVHTVCSDGVTGLGSLFMQLKTGVFKIGLIEAHSKVSNIIYPHHIEAFALDPILTRPLNIDPRFIAGMEMRAYLEMTQQDEYYTSLVVVKNRNNALFNPRAGFGATITAQDVLLSKPVASPLRELDCAPYADGAAVIIVATESIARNLRDDLVVIEGVGWAQHTPNLTHRDWVSTVYVEEASRRAYDMARMRNPKREVDFAEIDDTFSYKELQHIESLGLAREGESGLLLEEGYFDIEGEIPVNPSGGSLGCGYTFDMAGLRQIAESVLYLREENSLAPEVGLVQTWRGLPTSTGGVLVLRRER